MKRLALIGAIATTVGLSMVGGSTASDTLCVGGPHCYSSLQAAVDAASAGDTIQTLSVPKRDYVSAAGRNESLPEAAGRWDLGEIKLDGGGARIEVTGRRVTGADTVSGTGTLKANGQVEIAVTNKQDPRKGSFVFTFSAS